MEPLGAPMRIFSAQTRILGAQMGIHGTQMGIHGAQIRSSGVPKTVFWEILGAQVRVLGAPVAIREEIFLRVASFRSWKKWKSGRFSMSVGTRF